MTETVKSFLTEKNYTAIKNLLSPMNSADIEHILEELPFEMLPVVFRLLPKELAAETFAEMQSDMQQYLIKKFSDHELKEVLSEMYVDDTVDLIEEMPANVVSRILKYSDPETRSAINAILQYPSDSAGSIMTIEYVELKAHMTIDDAFSIIRRTGVDKETVYTCYVTDGNRKLIGVVTVAEMFLSDPSTKIGEIMETNVIFVNTRDDKEAAAITFNKYGFLALPVVDNEQRLVGIITFDDAIYVIQEENTEDMEIMAAMSPSDKPYMKTGVLETVKNRIPWLLLLMISAAFTGGIISGFESALAAQVVLTSFIPMLMDTGGNAGGQASVTIIRGLSLGEIEFKNIFRIIWKELRVALICGVTMAAANFIKIMLVDQVSALIAAVVCLTLLATVLIANVVGCILPVLAKKVGFDPAVMASPFITTIVDALSLLIYFGIARLLLGI